MFNFYMIYFFLLFEHLEHDMIYMLYSWYFSQNLSKEFLMNNAYL